MNIKQILKTEFLQVDPDLTGFILITVNKNGTCTIKTQANMYEISFMAKSLDMQIVKALAGELPNVARS